MKITVRELLEKLTMIVILLAMVFAIAWHPRTAQAANNSQLTVDLEVQSVRSEDLRITKSLKVTLYIDAGLSEKADSITGTYGQMVFNNGVATLNMDAVTNNSVKATDLPDGLYYAVSYSSSYYTFTTHDDNASGALGNNTNVRAVLTRLTGDLKITNTVSSIYASDLTKSFSIQIQQFDGTDLSGDFGGLSFGANGIATCTLKDGESITATGLPAGMTFMISELSISYLDYSTTGLGTYYIKANQTETVAITNTRIPPVTRFRGEIIWEDRNDQDGIRPASVDIQLYADGVVTGEPVTLSAANSWYHIWENLPKITNAEEQIVYTVDEVTVPTGYTKSVSGYMITNTHAMDKTSATAKALWVDNNDAAGQRPTELVVRLIADGVDSNKSVTLNAANNWEASLDNLFKNKNGTPISYTWEMDGLPGSYQLTDTLVNGTTTTLTNTLSTGGFKAGLTVASSDASDLDREFSFTASLKTEENGTAVSGIFGGKQFENGEYSFTMKSGDEIEFSEIPSGVYYSVKQTNLSGFNIYSSDRTGTVTTNTTSAVAFLFTKKTGGLFSVTNNVVSRLPSDSNLAFSYTLTLNDTSINGTYQDMEFTDGVASFSLKGGETKVAEGLPEGTGYTIKESEESGFTQTFQIVHGDTTTNSAWSSNGYSGTITDSYIVARFTNTRKVGDLEVSNELISDLEADKDVLFTFTVTLGEPDINGTFGDMEFLNSVATVKLKGGKTATATGLPVSLGYVVTEANVNGLQQTGESGDTGTISTTKSEAKFTNTRETGDLKLSKFVDSFYAGDSNIDFQFAVELGDNTISGTYGDMVFSSGVANVTLRKNETKTATGLPTGIAYTITEADTPGFELIRKRYDTGTISTTTSEAEFSNGRIVGEFRVDNHIVSSTASDMSKDFTFTATLKTGENGSPVSGDFGGKTFDANGKHVFTLSGLDGTYVFSDIPVGFYFDVEEQPEAGFTASWSDRSGTVVKGITGNVTFTNTRNEGDLKITLKNTVNGVTGDDDKRFRIKVTLADATINDAYASEGAYTGVSFTGGVAEIELKPTEWITIKGLPDNMSYTVSEELTSEDAAVFTYTIAGDTGRITKDAPQFAEVTNSRITGSLKIKKNVTVNGVAVTEANKKLADGTYKFSVVRDADQKVVAEPTITITDGESNTATVNNLELGSYTVSEDLSSLPVAVAIVGTNGVKATLTDATEQEVEITNNKSVGSLIIKKNVTVNGQAAPGSTLVDGTYTFSVKNEAGTEVATPSITVKDGMSNTAVVENLDPGVYTVTESTTGFEDKQIEVNGGNPTVIVPLTKNGEMVEFTNDRTLGSLKITSNVTVNGQPTTENLADGTYFFTVKNAAGEIWAQRDITVMNGVSSTETIDYLPYGTYTVTEDTSRISNHGISLISANDIPVIVDDTVPVAEFTHNKTVGSIKITNYVTVNGQSTTGTLADGTYRFTVTDSAGNEVATPSITITNGASNTVTVGNLGLGTYTVREDVTNLPPNTTLTSANDVQVTLTDSSIQEVSFTNDLREKIDCSVAIVWDDNNDQDGLRPASIKIQLKEDGTSAGGEITLSGANNWSTTVSGLPKYRNGGTEIVYTWEGSGIPTSYSLESSNKNGAITTLTYRHVPAEVSVKLDLVWVADQDLTVNMKFDLYRQSTGTARSKVDSKTGVLDTGTGWSGEFNGLPKYDGLGNEYQYEVVEEYGSITRSGNAVSVKFQTDMDSHDLSNDEKGIGITCTQLVDIPVQVTWDGGEVDTEDIIQLYRKLPGYADYTDTGRKFSLTKANGWSGTFQDYPKYANLNDAKNGSAISYEVRLSSGLAGYTTAVTGDVETGFTIRHTASAGTLQITASFAADANSKTLSSSDTSGVKITVTAPSGETTYQVGRDFTNGVLVLNDLAVGTYTVTEDVNSAHVNGYTLTVTGNAATVTVEAGKTKEVTIVNTYTGAEIWESYIYESGEKDYSSAKLDLKATASGNLAMLVKKAVRNGSGKWVRYGSDGSLVKGWYTVSTPTVEEIYYFDKQTGMKVTGDVVIDGKLCHFDSSSGLYQP